LRASAALRDYLRLFPEVKKKNKEGERGKEEVKKKKKKKKKIR